MAYSLPFFYLITSICNNIIFTNLCLDTTENSSRQVCCSALSACTFAADFVSVAVLGNRDGLAIFCESQTGKYNVTSKLCCFFITDQTLPLWKGMGCVEHVYDPAVRPRTHGFLMVEGWKLHKQELAAMFSSLNVLHLQKMYFFSSKLNDKIVLCLLTADWLCTERHAWSFLAGYNATSEGIEAFFRP